MPVAVILIFYFPFLKFKSTISKSSNFNVYRNESSLFSISTFVGILHREQYPNL